MPKNPSPPKMQKKKMQMQKNPPYPMQMSALKNYDV